MANKKVGVYRKYLEAVPVDLSGRPLAKSSWPKKRSFCWVARWFSAEGKRHSRSFRTKRQAQSFAAQKEIQIQEAQTAGLTEISLRAFHIEHKEPTQGNVATRTLALYLATLESLASFLGWDRPLHTIGPRDIERFRAGRLSTSTRQDSKSSGCLAVCGPRRLSLFVYGTDPLGLLSSAG